MKIEFFENGDNIEHSTIDVVLEKSKTDWEPKGTLVFDDEQNAWVLWDDAYLDNHGIIQLIGDGVTYYEDLNETEEQIKDELLG